MEIGGALIARGDQHRVQPRLALRAADRERGFADGVDLHLRLVIAQRQLVEDLDGVRAHDAIGIALRDGGERALHLRMLEVLERLHDFDADVGRRVGEHASEGGKRARIADAAERFDGGPLDVGVGERGDERLDGARIFHAAERVGGGDADPPVGIVQQLDGRGDDAHVLETGGDGDGAGANVGIGIVQQLDDRLDERVAELAQRLERAVADEAGQRRREADVAPDHAGLDRRCRGGFSVPRCGWSASPDASAGRSRSANVSRPALPRAFVSASTMIC